MATNALSDQCRGFITRGFRRCEAENERRICKPSAPNPQRLERARSNFITGYGITVAAPTKLDSWHKGCFGNVTLTDPAEALNGQRRPPLTWFFDWYFCLQSDPLCIQPARQQPPSLRPVTVEGLFSFLLVASGGSCRKGRLHQSTGWSSRYDWKISPKFSDCHDRYCWYIPPCRHGGWSGLTAGSSRLVVQAGRGLCAAAS